ncbi:MAG: DUF3106 domain-containing protein [Planctomycetota bacterium]
MIPLLLLALAPQVAEQAPAEVQQVEDPRAWWEQMTPEERERMRERMKALRELPPEVREEFGKRYELIKQERAAVKENLTSEEKKTYKALGRHERRRFLDERVRANLAAQGEGLRDRFPDAPEFEGRGDYGERFRASRELLLEKRGEQVREEIQKAVREGWLGPRTATWLEKAGIEESMAVLGEVRKWQFIEKAAEDGFWERSGIDETRRAELLLLPPPEFFRAVRGQVEGSPWRGGPERFRDRRDGGPPGMRPPKEGRGGPRGEGRGSRDGRPPRGPGAGPGPDEGPPPERKDGGHRGPRPRPDDDDR